MLHRVDPSRSLVIPGDSTKTIEYAVDHLIRIANLEIEKKGEFSLALSGGSTPKVIFNLLSKEDKREAVDWTKVLLFWSDERAVAPDQEESNFKMAMDAGMNTLPFQPQNIFRMKAEENIEQNTREYQKTLQEKTEGKLDFVMLGMGEDGHTASLFPYGENLDSADLVIPNLHPKTNEWRMSLTFTCINKSSHIVVYVLGEGKASILAKVLQGPISKEQYPAQGLGTPENPCLFIADEAASHDCSWD